MLYLNRMNKFITFLLIFLGISLLAGTTYFAYQYFKTQKQLKFNLQPSPLAQFCLPPVDGNYKVKEVQRFTNQASQEEFLVFGMQSNAGLDNQNQPSYLAIYKEMANGLDEVYKFALQLPQDQQAGMLLLENLWLNNNLIISSWGQVGASYFGSYPVIIAYKDNKFQPLTFYEGNMADNPQLKTITWTQPDSIVKNLYEQSQEVKTILTQGISLGDQNINLRFYADNNCHACEHEYLYLSFPLP